MAVEHPDRPLRIGAVGHRILADLGRLEAGIDEALERILSLHPGRSLEVVSSLAEGADRLIVRRVMARFPEAPLIAVLPRPRDAYREDFASVASREEFMELLARAACVVEPEADETQRGEGYRRAGAFVVESADLLVALWDGRRGQGRGGTAEVVALARRRGLPLAWIRAGNRRPGTGEPTSLGAEQGRVSFERLGPGRGAAGGGAAGGVRSADAAGGAGGGAAETTGPPESPGLAYRIRVGVLAAAAPADPDALERALAGTLRPAILGLFDERSRRWIERARHTPVGFSLIPAGHAPGTRPGALAAETPIARALDARVEAIDPTGAPPPGRARGRFLIDRCDVLVVLGALEREPGGGEEAAALLAAARARERPVLHIEPGARCRLRLSHGHGLNARSIVRLDRFNGLPIGKRELEAYVENAYRDILGSEAGRRLPAGNRELVRTRLLPFYARASLLAKRSQRIYRRAGQLVWLLFPAAIAAVAVGVHAPALALPAFALELLLLATIAAVVTYADRRRSLQIWIESRFLAERLRAAAHLAACGHEAAPLRVAPYRGGTEQRDAWMVMAFNEAWAALPPLRGCTAETCAAVRDFVDGAWVAGQIEYHRANAARCGRLGQRLERWGTIMFLLALVAATLHIALPRPEHGAGALEAGLTILAILLPAVGAALGGFRSHREFSRLAKRSRNMVQELSELRERLAEAEDPESLRRILRETEETMLGETQDWLMLMRFVPVQYPG